jgi:glycerate dehydrogenase
MTKIVVLDGYTANPGDLTWESLHRLGELTVHDRTAPADVVSRAAGAEIVLTNKTVITADAIRSLPDLKMVSVLATGFNIVDVAAAKARGIPVCNVPEYSTPNVAQAVFALLLELTNRTGHHDATVHAGRWAACPDFCYWDGDLVELSGLTFGIVGHGRIGRAVGHVARAFGMKVLYHRRSHDGEPGCVDLDTLFSQSDVVSLHCPLTPETNAFVNASRIEQMKPTAFLLNTARGALVVLSVEPPSPSNPLLAAPRCVITPHIAWATRDARRRLLETTAGNVAAFLAGSPRHVVNA